MSPGLKNWVRSFLLEFWDVFCEEGVKMPVRGYEMLINMGKHWPVACQQPRCGPPIVKLLDLGFIKPNSGGACKLELCLSKKWLLPVAFGPRKTKENEVHFHSHPGKSIAASQATVKNQHFLWGRQFTLITNCRALMWQMDYKGNNHVICRLYNLKCTGPVQCWRMWTTSLSVGSRHSYWSTLERLLVNCQISICDQTSIHNTTSSRTR